MTEEICQLDKNKNCNNCGCCDGYEEWANEQQNYVNR